MPVQSWTSHFTDRAQAIAEIEAAGLHCIDSEVMHLAPDQVPHAHDYEIHLYVLEGAVEVRDPDTGVVHRAGPGGKLFVAAGTLHCGVHGGYRGVIGLTTDPARYMPQAPAEEVLATV